VSEEPFGKLTTFLKKLDRARIHYSLACHREGAIMVLVTVPGERWEIEFLAEGSIEVERFLSSGEIWGEEVLAQLLAKHVDSQQVDATRI
jgi:hypothetical protein